jgi:prepilin-type N-terminal cleavage/methylation domain-containing protein
MQNQQQSGFTLIELMIVVAIISILAAVSTAYFGDNITSARRTDGRTALLNAAATLEKCKAVYGAYELQHYIVILHCFIRWLLHDYRTHTFGNRLHPTGTASNWQIAGR